MQQAVCRPDGLESYKTYTGLLELAGHQPDRHALAAHLAGQERAADMGIEEILSEEGAGAAARMGELLTTLVDELAAAFGPGAPASAQDLVRALGEAGPGQRDAAGDAVLLNGHRQFLQPRYMELSEFHRLLEEHGSDRLALVKLAPFLAEELGKRGFRVSWSELRSWFERRPEPCQVPWCLRQIMRQVGEEFLGGLIDLEDLVGERDPDEWLEEARLKLRFRSHSSMHKAVAEATSLKYDCVHKALSGRKKAKRIQAEIKYCLDQWLADAAAGREPDIADAHRGVPVEQMHGLLERLEQKFRTKEEIYRAIAGKTGLKTGSVRRYFQSNGQLKYAPLDVCDWAERLAQEEGQPCVRQSYLADSRTRRAAERLADRAREALTRWRSCEDDGELEMAYRELRRTLIVTIKEGQRAGALMRA